MHMQYAFIHLTAVASGQLEIIRLKKPTVYNLCTKYKNYKYIFLY